MKIAALGPEGTYSAEAARIYDPEAEVVLTDTKIAAISKVAFGAFRRGIVPFENSIGGTVRESFDGLFKYGLTIEDEVEVEINHTVWANKDSAPADQIVAVHSHPQALAQCNDSLTRHFPNAQRIEASSTAAGLKFLADTGASDAIALGPDFAGDQYDLVALEKSFQDEANNTTQFVVFSKQPRNPKELDFTIAVLVPEEEHKGLMHEITGVVLDADVNMSRLEARPNRTELGKYIFYVRLDLPSNDERYEEIAQGLSDKGVQIIRMSA
ncbi:MAG: prephenate dehydratase domain-containing protein [Patescibacteria group bacterium]